ncbi:Man1-Src1p-C-terminal domain [Nakaseomyces glabratus]
MLEKDLFNNVYEEYKDMMTKESFEKEWAVLSNSLKRLPEIYYKTFVSKNVAGNIENIQLFRSLSKQNVSYFCGIFKLLKEFPIEKNVLLVALTIFSCTVTLEIILQKLWKCQNRENAFVEKSTEKALEKLREASRDPEVKFLDTVQLREFLLSETTNLKKKNQLWDKISSKLLENENVEKRQMELYGEVLGIWEWND